jgi:O-antigen ligase
MTQAALPGLHRWTPALAIIGAVGTAVVMVGVHGGLAICMAAALGLVLVSTTRFDPTNLIIAFVVSQPAVGFLKRAIFLMGPQPSRIYHVIQGICTLLFLLALVTSARRLSWARLPISGRILLAYLAVSWLTTLLVPGASAYERTIALLTRALPPAAFFVGLAIGMGGLLRVARVVLVIVLASVAYGAFHFVYGPSPVEQAWATHMRDASLQAGKLYAHIAGHRVLGEVPEFRVFSFYSNPLDWGLFLLSSMVLLALSRIHRHLSEPAAWLGIAAAGAGLVLTLSRSPIAGLSVMIGVLLLLRVRALQRPWVLMGLIAAAFACVIAGSNFLIATFGDATLPDQVVARRFLTVGTLEDRVHAWKLLLLAAQESWLIGRGYGQAWILTHKGMDDLMGSHNFVVDLVLYVGLPGLFLLVLFYVRWLRESLTALRSTRSRVTSQTICLFTAFSIGFLSIGFFSGDRILTCEFFLMMGALSSWLARSGERTGVGSSGRRLPWRQPCESC